MMYLEYSDAKKRPVAQVFSTTDSGRELDKFRCLVKAPKASYVESPNTRPHLVLFGDPREQAAGILVHVFKNPKERQEWEHQQGLRKEPQPDAEAQGSLDL